MQKLNTVYGKGIEQYPNSDALSARDIELYLHDLLEETLFKHGWELIEKTSRKASYRLVKKN